MKPYVVVLLLCLAALFGLAPLPVSAQSAGGLVGSPVGITTRQSRFGVVDAMDRLEAFAKAAGGKVYARIDIAGIVRKSGGRIPPNQVLIFDPGKSLTALVQKAPMVTLDLPLKLTVWEDPAGKTWVTYTNATYLAQRYRLDGAVEAVRDVDAAVNQIVEAAMK